MKKPMKKVIVLAGAAVLAGIVGYGPAAGQLPSGKSAAAVAASTPAAHAAASPTAQHAVAAGAAVATPAAERALLDQYCVTCHSDKLKTANLSLQKLDINTVGDHAEEWEKVIRKLRAGMMPPPGMPRPTLAKYEGLRDYLENEIDRKAAGRSNPGSVVMHRLNRTEYATVIHDLLDLNIDTSTLLPPDDSARGHWRTR